jgi:selenide,water dikinase
VLRPIQEMFSPADYPDLLVGLGDPDDAAVWRLDEQRALVVTTDFFTPVVDDPYDYGAIAAANALSDVYAMGGRPFLALNIAALPPDLPSETTGAILRGGADKAREAGVALAGGHTVQDEEPKYGLVVLGFADVDHILTKGGARAGDILVISKPLGFGTVATALKRDLANPADVAEAVDWMKRLNKTASELAVEFGLKSGTDVTGYSLLGHGLEVANSSGVGLQITLRKVPFLSHARDYADEWIFPGGSFDNRTFYEPHVRFAAEIEEAPKMLLFDAQTSGGLLLCVPPSRLEAMMKRAAQLDQPLWEIGEVIEGSGIDVVA